jgi:cytochrome-b5 reductase
MSQHLDHMKVGEVIDVKGPKGLFTYTPNMKRAFGMLAGGTGLTYVPNVLTNSTCSAAHPLLLLLLLSECRPMLQVIQAILKNPEDRTQVSLIFANVTEDDILLRSTLEDLAAKHPDRFKLHYTLDKVFSYYFHSFIY